MRIVVEPLIATVTHCDLVLGVCLLGGEEKKEYYEVEKSNSFLYTTRAVSKEFYFSRAPVELRLLRGCAMIANETSALLQRWHSVAKCLSQ